MYFEIYTAVTLGLIALYLALSIRRVCFVHKPYFTGAWLKRELILHGAYLLYAIAVVVLTERMNECPWDLMWYLLVVAPYFTLFLSRYIAFVPVRASFELWRLIARQEGSRHER